jgi:hypothetical protein
MAKRTRRNHSPLPARVRDRRAPGPRTNVTPSRRRAGRTEEPEKDERPAGGGPRRSVVSASFTNPSIRARVQVW